MKTGYKTTEFWLTLVITMLAPIVMVLSASGLLSPDVDQTEVVDSLSLAITNAVESVVVLVTLISGTFAASKYTQSRSDIKQSETLTMEN